MATKPKDYDEKALKALTSVEAVRAKAGMYIGPTDAAGVFTVLREVLDNVVDEALSGNASKASVLIAEDGSYYVHDDGRGMPTGPMDVEDNISGTKYKLPGLQVITSVLHAGGKLDADSAYAVSRGSHGIGIKATNFLSTFFNIATFYKGAWWEIGFKQGKMVKPVTKLKGATYPNPFGNKPLTKGTLVHFKPDAKIFSASSFPGTFIAEWANMAAYFTPGFTVEIQHHSGKHRVVNHPGGPKQYVADQIKKTGAQALSEAIFHHADPLMDVVLQFTNYDGCGLQAFTNGLSNPERGVHFNALFNAMFDAIKPFVKSRQEFTMNELRDGVLGVINVKMSSPRFASQTKEKLVDERGDAPVRDILLAQFTAFFRKNKALTEDLCKRCFDLKQLKTQFKASREVIGKLRKAAQGGLPAKAALALRCTPAERELYLLEGESAAGGCFIGSTLVPTSDGPQTLAALNAKNSTWTGPYLDVATGTVLQGEFTAPFVTKETTELVEVELAEGRVLTCTPDHLFLTSDGTYVRADELEGKQVVLYDAY